MGKIFTSLKTVIWLFFEKLKKTQNFVAFGQLAELFRFYFSFLFS